MSSHWARLRIIPPVAALVGLALSPAWAAEASTATAKSPGVQVAGAALAAPAQVAAGQAKVVGATSAAQPMRLVIGLKTPHAAEEEAFLQSLQDKSSPNFHKYLTAAQWNARFAPSAAAEASVVKWATQNGLTVTQRFANRLLVDVQASAGTIQKAFGVKINNYKLGTKSFFSNDRTVSLPSALSSVVGSVQGMNSLQALIPSNPAAAKQTYPAYSAGAPKAVGATGGANGSRKALAAAMAVSKAKAAKAKAGGVTPGITNGFYDPTDIYSSQAYDVDALNAQNVCCNPTHAAGQTPARTSIAIATAGAHNSADYAGFHNQYPYLAYHFQEFNIDGTPSCCDIEGTMDFEWSTAMANSFGSLVDTAMVYMYDGANNLLSTFTDIWNRMLSDNVARTMSTSWGCAEIYCYDSGTANTDHSIFNSMLGQGWTLVGISHDHGPYSDCSHVVANYPGSDPDLVSAGGTTLQAAGVFSSEVAWTGGTTAGSCASNNGGGGGGCSQFFGKPSWQGVATQCSNRAEPDLALNASIGQNIYVNGSLSGNGGTSIVAPELSGIFTHINSYLQSLGNVCSGNTACPPIGDPHSDLYNSNSGSPHHPYYDITSGCTSNDIGGGYCAGTGYDLATGLGSANMLQLAWSMMWFNVPELTAPTTTITGPTTGAYHNGGTLSWTIVDGGSPPTGVAGWTAKWDADPGDPTSMAHGGSGNSFYSGPANKNSTSGSISLASAGQGCHTLYVRAWDNIGDSSVRTYGSVCYDATAPVVTARPDERLVVGAISHGNAPVKTLWTATDALSGIQGYQVYLATDGGSYVYQGFQAANSITQYLGTGHKYQYGVYAEDNAGNFSAFSVSPAFVMHGVQESSASIVYSTGWTAAALTGASGGQVKYSLLGGKTAKFTFSGNRIAFVSTQSPSRGTASVTLDANAPVNLNLHGSTTVPGYVAWVGNLSTASHTVTIKNLGTPNTRIDLDEFVYIAAT